MYEKYITQQPKLTHKYELKLDKHMMKTNRNYTVLHRLFCHLFKNLVSVVLYTNLVAPI
jgi:hypothetical protein